MKTIFPHHAVHYGETREKVKKLWLHEEFS